MKRLLALFLAIVLMFNLASCQKLPSQNTYSENNSSEAMETLESDKVTIYTENWKDNYFAEEEIQVSAENEKDENIKAYIAKYTVKRKKIPYLIYEDGKRVVIRNLQTFPIGDKTVPSSICLYDLDGDKIDEIIIPNLKIYEGKSYTLIYKITDIGFEEFLNTKDISDYGYYLEPQSNESNIVNIKNKYADEAYCFNNLSENNKYFYNEDGNFKTDIILEYSNIISTNFQDVNDDGVFEMIIDRYAVVRGCPTAVLTKTTFSYNGEKFIVVDAEYEQYADNRSRRRKEIDSDFGSSLLISQIPEFEEGDTVFGEKFILWFIVNELYDHTNGIITPYYQPYECGESGSLALHNIPKQLVKEVLKENFAVEISSEPTKYDNGDYYTFTRTGFGYPNYPVLDSVNRSGNIMIVNYKIKSSQNTHFDEPSEEVGTMEIAIDNNGKGKVLYFRPKYYK